VGDCSGDRNQNASFDADAFCRRVPKIALVLGRPIVGKFSFTSNAAFRNDRYENGPSIAKGANNSMPSLMIRGSFLVGQVVRNHRTLFPRCGLQFLEFVSL
jgi:hypothetical protein